MGDWEPQHFSSRQAESGVACRQQGHRHTASATRPPCAVAGTASRPRLVPSTGTDTLSLQPQHTLWDIHVLRGFRGADLCLCWENFDPCGCGRPFRQPIREGIPSSLSALTSQSQVTVSQLWWCRSFSFHFLGGRNQRCPFKPQVNWIKPADFARLLHKSLCWQSCCAGNLQSHHNCLQSETLSVA